VSQPPQPPDPAPAQTWSPSAARYVETIFVPWWWWLLGLGFVMSMTAVFLPVHPWAGLLALVACALGVIVAFTRWRLHVEVTPTQLRAGRAHVPTMLLGEVQALDAATMRAERGPRLNGLAFLCLRGWVATGVRVALCDPEDPTPYWLVSSRHPQALAEFLRTAVAASKAG
jgi:hypothetical protein